MALVLLVLMGMQIPGASDAAAALLVLGLVLVLLATNRGLSTPVVIRASVLAAFVIVYESRLVAFDLIQTGDAARLAFLIPGLYLVGHEIGVRCPGMKPVACVAILGASGFIIFSFLSTVTSLSFSAAFQLEFLKTVPAFWTGQGINRPMLGTLASLGLCLVPALFVALTGEWNKSRVVSMLVALLAAAGVYSNVLLANRAPFVAALLAFVVVLTCVRSTHGNTALRVALLTIIAFGVMYFAFGHAGLSDASQLYIYQRFLDEGLYSTGRFDSWMAMLANLTEWQSGGRLADIAGNTFVHNLWLDVAWDAGTFAFLLLIVFHAMHVSAIRSLARSSTWPLEKAAVLGIVVSVVTAFIQEPIMANSQMYFAFTCWLLGLLFGAKKVLQYEFSPSAGFVDRPH